MKKPDPCPTSHEKSAAHAASCFGNTTHQQSVAKPSLQRIALLGCGTHNQLLALKLLESKQSTRNFSLTFFDCNSNFDRAKTISCHSTDVPCELKEFMAPYWKRSWPSYLIKFPNPMKPADPVAAPFQRIGLGYQTLDLELMRSKLIKAAHEKQRLLEFVWNTKINSLSDLDEWVLSRSLPPFDLIIDTRSQQQPPSSGGVQQFFGATYRFDAGHGYTLPIIMDATCEQPQNQAGYRFVYFLPLSEQELLIEDTRLLLRPDEFRELETHVESIAQQIKSKNMCLTAEIVHREKGLIPIPFLKHQKWRSPLKKETAYLVKSPIKKNGGKTQLFIQAGMGSGFFHPTTGYSLPLALESVSIIEKHLFETGELTRAYCQFGMRTARSWNFALLFNFFLFFGFKPSDSWNAFSYFYRLPCSFIRAFYCCKLNILFLWVLLTRPPPSRFQSRRLLTCLKFWILGS